MTRMFKAIIAISLLMFTMVSTAAPLSYAEAVKRAASSVVNVYTNRPASSGGQDSRFNSQTRNRRPKATLGSGVIIDRKGYILTNYHVIRRMNRVMVALMDGRTTQAKVVGADPETDLAVLHIHLPNLQPISVANSDDVQVGDVVLAIGNPFGLGQTVTQGIVSAIGRNTIGLNSLENYIQTDAAINPGNSGGALINTEGSLIGINTGIYTRSGGYQGVGFAIPIDNALNVMQQIIKTGKVVRGWLGVEVVTMDEDHARSLGVQQVNGVAVDDVIPNSPANKAGVKRNDIVLSVNNREVRTARGFQSYVAQRKPGDTVNLMVLRDGTRRTVSITLASRPLQPILDDRARPEDRGTYRGPIDDR